MVYEITYKNFNRNRKMIVSAGFVDETVMKLEGNGIKVLSVKERLIRRAL